LACDAPPRQCLEWHIKPKLRKVRPSSDDNGELKGYRALCPAHNDRHHSFSISVSDDGKFIRYQCFKCNNRKRERLALINECGISERCLPVPAKEARDLLEYIVQLLGAPTDNHAEVRLRAMAAAEGYDDLPRGKELERIAGLTGVSAAAAYSYRRRKPPVKPDNTSSYPPGSEPVKPRRSA
jgi:hypothetical protein